MGKKGITCSVMFIDLSDIPRPAHEGQNPRHLQLKATQSIFVSHNLGLEAHNLGIIAYPAAIMYLLSYG